MQLLAPTIANDGTSRDSGSVDIAVKINETNRSDGPRHWIGAKCLPCRSWDDDEASW